MARQARSALADSRALEEQQARVTMHGAGRFIGAGGVPSMGLSQFVGGAHGDSDSDEDCCKMCGGAAPPGTTYRLALQRGGPRSYAGPTSTAIVPFRPQPVRGPITRFTPSRPLRPTPTTLTARMPGTIKPFSAAEQTARLAALRGAPKGTSRGKPGSRSAMAARAAQLLAMGIPLAALGAYLGTAGTSGSAGDAGSSGYYDDYVGEGDADGDGIPDNLDPYPNGGDPTGEGMGPMGGPGGLPSAGLSEDDIAFYLRSGNLPDRFYASPRNRKGSGKAPSGRRSARAAIVKKVMSEMGMKLTDASRYVKENNLF